jgi:hypothetical protein
MKPDKRGVFGATSFIPPVVILRPAGGWPGGPKLKGKVGHTAWVPRFVFQTTGG